MHYISYRRNRPASTLIKEYCDKKSGKVSEARRELQRRFEGLDWSQQKKILLAHLQACPSDRQWAYPRVLSLWDESFTSVIEELWKTYNEQRCSWIIVNHFPEEYLKCHLDELSQGRNYFFICRRLGHDPQFQPDTSRLLPIDYLSLMAHLGRTVPVDTAMRQLLTIAKQECLSPHYYSVYRQWTAPRLTKPTPLHISTLNRAYYYLQETPHSDEARQQFEEWCHRVADEVQHDESFVSLLKQSLSDDDFNQQAYHLLLSHIATNLPEEVRNARLQAMADSNSALGLLTDKLGLEEEVTPPSPPIRIQSEYPSPIE